VREARRLRSEQHRRNDGVLRGNPVAVEGREREDLVTHRHVVDVLTDLRDHT
jgi:hypothetical protein